MNIQIKEQMTVKGSCDVVKIMREVYSFLNEEDSHKEVFYVLGLNAQNKIIFIDLISLGTVNRACPIIRECLRQAIVKNAVGIIAVHNHPSGTFNPSPEDRIFTDDLRSACKIVGVCFLDHIILGDGYFSFSDGAAGKDGIK